MLSLLVLFFAGCAVTPSIVVDNPPQTTPLQAIPLKHHPVIALALGGGASRGFAHVGVLNVLQSSGIKPDIVVGTSAGAVVGVLYAGGIRGRQLEEMALVLNQDQIVDWSYSGRGFIRGELLQDYVNKYLGNRSIEQFKTVFAATATDLTKGKLVVFTQGDPGVAVRASSTIPGLVSPVTIDGRDYVDGGLVSKVPVRVARQLGADIVIAVDVSRPPSEHEPLTSTFAVMQQALAIMSQAVVAEDLPLADVVIRPELGVMSINDFDMRQQAIEAGEKAALAALDKIKKLIAQKQQRRFLLKPKTVP
jgi:NTE family protein